MFAKSESKLLETGGLAILQLNSNTNHDKKHDKATDYRRHRFRRALARLGMPLYSRIAQDVDSDEEAEQRRVEGITASPICELIGASGGAATAPSVQAPLWQVSSPSQRSPSAQEAPPSRCRLSHRGG